MSYHQIKQLLIVNTETTGGVGTCADQVFGTLGQIAVCDRGQKLFGTFVQYLLDAPQHKQSSQMVVGRVGRRSYAQVVCLA